MTTEFLKLILTVVIGFALRLLLSAIGVEIDEELFNTLVAGIVLWILTLLGMEVAYRLAPRMFKRY